MREDGLPVQSRSRVLADELVRALRPKSACVVGPGSRALVEGLKSRGVPARSLDWTAADASSTGRSSATPHHDLIVCLDPPSNLSAAAVDAALSTLAGAGEAIVFSPGDAGNLDDSGEGPRSALEWIELFRGWGFEPDPFFDATFVAPDAMLFRRGIARWSDDVMELFCRLMLAGRSGRVPEPEPTPLEVEHHPHLTRVPELEAIKTSLEAQAKLARSQRAQLQNELNSLLDSPGWQFLQNYRRFLNRRIFPHPWLANPYESFAGLLLEAGGLRAVSSRRNSSERSNSSEGRAPGAYEDWIEDNEPSAEMLAAQPAAASKFSYQPSISVIVPVYEVPLDQLQACVQSVLDQTWSRWELWIADASPPESGLTDYLESIVRREPRVRLTRLDSNRGISENTNVALSLATGEFVAFLDHDDTLAPFALFEVAEALAAERSLDLIYSDHDYIDAAGRRFNPLFKPDWSPDILLSSNYITHLTVIRRTLVESAGGFDPATDGAQDWDLFLRVTEKTQRIRHVPRILYHWRVSSRSTALNNAAKPYAQTAQILAIQNHLDRTGVSFDAEALPSGLLHVRSRYPQPRVSIVIPTLNNTSLIRRSIETILRNTDYPDFEILIADTGTTDEETLAYYETLAGVSNVRILHYEKTFNYSAVNNFAARAATGELLLFLNNDMEITSPEWLAELAAWAQVPGVGVVGAKLLLASGKLQHAGVVVGLTGFGGHPFAGENAHTFGIFGSTDWYRNYLAVTGACLMIRRDLFREIGGFSEAFILCGSDVELCLRARKRGYRVVVNPFAELIHLESQTRSSEIPTQDFEASFTHYRNWLENGDPFWNPNLSLWNCSPQLRGSDEKPAFDFAVEHLKALRSAARGAQWLTGTPKAAAGPVSEEAIEEARIPGWFDFTSRELALSREATAKHSGPIKVKTLIWFIPPFENVYYGGAHTILRFADAWWRHYGVRSIFAVCGVAAASTMLQRIRSVHPACGAADVIVLGRIHDATNLPQADACIATLWMTAYYALRFNRVKRKLYLIQDDEASFYRAGSVHALVESTYRFGFYGIANTVSLRDMYEREFGGNAVYFTPCIDFEALWPSRNPRAGSVRQLFCYGRPQHARNGFELLTGALKKVKRTMGPKVRIVSAGAAWEPRACDLDGVVENLGLLSYADAANVYRNSDAGVVLMFTRHPSYIPLELMASGSLVVTNRNNWTSWLLKDEQNCLLSDASASCLAETIVRGLEDEPLRRAITANALAEVRENFSDWSAQIEAVFAYVCAPDSSRPSDLHSATAAVRLSG